MKRHALLLSVLAFTLHTGAIAAVAAPAGPLLVAHAANEEKKEMPSIFFVGVYDVYVTDRPWEADFKANVSPTASRHAVNARKSYEFRAQYKIFIVDSVYAADFTIHFVD